MAVTISCLLDTDVSVEILRGRDAGLRERLATERIPGISAITRMELAFGARRGRSRTEVLTEQYLRRVESVGFDADAAERAADVRAVLAAAGTPIGHYDTLIAGHALALDVPLVTRNIREFQRVPGLSVALW